MYCMISSRHGRVSDVQCEEILGLLGPAATCLNVWRISAVTCFLNGQVMKRAAFDLLFRSGILHGGTERALQQTSSW